MYRLKVHLVGKSKEAWLQEAEKLYITRLCSSVQIETVIYRTQEKMESVLQNCTNLVLLDPKGVLMDSEKLADHLQHLFTACGSRLEIAMGGAEGFSLSFAKKYPKISFSLLTYTHQICRLVLWEQLYRCSEIWKGSGYHK